MTNHCRVCAWLIGALIVCTASLQTPFLAADEITAEQKEEALSYFKEGSRAYERGDYEGAIDWFRKSFELVRSPELVYNIGRCYEELKKNEDAIYHYEMYVRFYPTSEESEEARHRINMLREVDERGGSGVSSTPPREAPGDDGDAEDEEGAGLDADREDAWYSDVNVISGLRFAVGLFEPTDAPVMGLDIGADFPVFGWLTAWADLFFGGYLGEDESGLLLKDAPKNQVALAAGLGTRWFLAEKFVWGLGAGFSIAGVALEHTRLTWPAGEVLAYGIYRFSGGFGVTARLFGVFGPLYGRSAGDRGIEVGGLVGVSYTFGGKSEGSVED